MRQARAVFQCQSEPDIHLTVDNARRKAINKQCNTRLAPKDATLLDAEDGDILLYPGCPLIGTKIQYGIVNAVWYDVEDVDETTLHLFNDRN